MSQKYLYRVWCHTGEGHYLLIGDAEGTDADDAVEAAVAKYQPTAVSLLHGAEFVSAPVSRCHTVWKQLVQQTSFLTLDGPPAPPVPEQAEDESERLAAQVLADAAEAERSLPIT